MMIQFSQFIFLHFLHNIYIYIIDIFKTNSYSVPILLHGVISKASKPAGKG